MIKWLNVYERNDSIGHSAHLVADTRRSGRNRLGIMPGVWLYIFQPLAVCADGFLL